MKRVEAPPTRVFGRVSKLRFRCRGAIRTRSFIFHICDRPVCLANSSVVVAGRPQRRCHHPASQIAKQGCALFVTLFCLKKRADKGASSDQIKLLMEQFEQKVVGCVFFTTGSIQNVFLIFSFHPMECTTRDLFSWTPPATVTTPLRVMVAPEASKPDCKYIYLRKYANQGYTRAASSHGVLNSIVL